MLTYLPSHGTRNTAMSLFSNGMERCFNVTLLHGVRAHGMGVQASLCVGNQYGTLWKSTLGAPRSSPRRQLVEAKSREAVEVRTIQPTLTNHLHKPSSETALAKARDVTNRQWLWLPCSCLYMDILPTRPTPTEAYVTAPEEEDLRSMLPRSFRSPPWNSPLQDRTDIWRNVTI